MALVAPVVDGKIQSTSAGANALNADKSKDSSSLDKDAFLQLLVAQMKYQDPLEPTSNTEYISQLATFSELEEMQNLRAGMDMQRASSLVGKEVYVKSNASTSGFVNGRVDYVLVENGKAYLSIEEALYPLEDLDTIVDSDYSSATAKAKKFIAELRKLPRLREVTISDKEKIMGLQDQYDKMSEYEKSFIAKDIVKELTSYVDKIKEIENAMEDSGNEDGDGDEDNSDKDDTGSEGDGDKDEGTK